MSISSKIKFSLVAASLLMYGCGNEKAKLPSASDGDSILNIGHAGSGFNYLFSPFNPLPPNGFSSLTNALENGADGVEVDLQITADYQLILFHDIHLDDRTGLTGNVAQAQSVEVIGTPYHCGFPYDLFQNDSIITFKRWIAYASGLSNFPYLQIDIKSGNGQTEPMLDSLLTKMLAELKEVNYPFDKVIAISVDQHILTRLMGLDSTLSCAFEPQDFSAGLNWAVENNCRFLIMDHKDLTPKNVQTAHEKGVGVIAFGGKSKSTLLKIISMKPDFIQSNNVRLLHELL